MKQRDLAMPIDKRFWDSGDETEFLRDAASGYRFIAEAASDAILTIDEHSTIVFANPAVESVFGYTSAEVLGQKLTELMPDRFRARHRTAMERYLSTGKKRFEWSGVQLQGLHKDGREIQLEVSFGEMIRGRRRYFVGVLRDVTMRFNAEKAKLSTERIARNAAEAASRMKDEFLITLSHELRTPLNAIVGWAAFLRQEFDPKRLDQALASIERNARLQVQLIDDLLDVSRIVSGKLRLTFGPVDLPNVIEAAAEASRPSAAAKRIVIDVDCPGRAAVRGDTDRLKQVMGNLLSNAIKFTPEGGHVAVACRADAPHALITVTDTGEGIPEELLPHVFERFRQVDSGPRRRYGGLGLGLSIVRHLVDAHCGQISAASRGPGKGAVFSVRLPLDSSPMERSDNPHLEEKSLLVELDGIRVLVVDDRPDELELFETVLSSFGATVTVRDSVDAGLQAVKDRRPDVIVSDIAMPGRDGYEMIQTIRRDAMTRSIPALALTAHARQEDRQHALGAGFNAYLAKPVEPVRLVRALAALIRFGPKWWAEMPPPAYEASIEERPQP